MHEIKESDWKIFRQLYPVSLERFCQRVLDENERLLNDTGQGVHERYVAIYQLFHQRDKELARLFDNFRRSTALLQILAIKRHGLITEEEFARFSEETRDYLAGFEREF